MDAGHDDDVVELGARRPRLPGGWRPSRGAGVLAAATLAVGLAAGYAAGGSHGGAAAPRATVTVTATPRPTPSDSGIATPATAFSFADVPALTQDVASCAAQSGHDLQLGVQVSNQATDAILLRTARAVLPMGGLKPLAVLWGPCGSLQTAAVGRGTEAFLQPGETAWLTIIFRVQVVCPTPLPVQFSVEYLEHGRSVTAKLPGFVDLGGVPYTGCGKPT
ncbi:MAG TPA: hypothetical protein VMI73_13110 [Trebonia sp.]|nr:hypothetical protein [Trebonia sp.]